MRKSLLGLFAAALTAALLMSTGAEAHWRHHHHWRHWHHHHHHWRHWHYHHHWRHHHWRHHHMY